MKKFKTKLKGGGRDNNWAYFTPPFDPEKEFGRRGRVPIRGAINGFPFRSSLTNMGDGWLMIVNRQMRAGAGVDIGQTVTIELDLDTAKRTITPPADLKRALAANAKAQEFWKKLSFTHQKEYVVWIAEAKKEETRQRRLSRTIELLTAGKRERYQS